MERLENVIAVLNGDEFTAVKAKITYGYYPLSSDLSNLEYTTHYEALIPYGELIAKNIIHPDIPKCMIDSNHIDAWMTVDLIIIG